MRQTKILYLIFVLILVSQQIRAEIVTGVGEYDFGVYISQVESCKLAQQRALNDARRQVSDEKISSQQSKICTASKNKNECDLFSDTWSYIDTVVIKSEPIKISQEIVDKESFKVCRVVIEADVEKFPTPSVNFDFNLSLSKNKFIASTNENTTDARLSISIEPENNKEMYINVFHYEPHVYGRNVSRIYPREYNDSNMINSTLLLPKKGITYRVIFPGAITEDSVHEGILVVSSREDIQFNSFYTYDQLSTKLLSISNNDVRIKREMYVVIKED